MKIDKDMCIGCEECQPFCPVGAISTETILGRDISWIDQEKCVECGVCLKSSVCPTDAIFAPDLEMPRRIRVEFSNPLVPHSKSADTKIGGRGTEEMKTNDVTGRFPKGAAGVVIELGRPGIGTTFRDIEIMSKGLAKLGVVFGKNNPLIALFKDVKTGEIKEEFLNERVLSAILEFDVEIPVLKDSLAAIQELSKQIDTVFSLGLISRVYADGGIPVVSIAEEAGYTVSENAKVNVGLGRPLVRDIKS